MRKNKRLVFVCTGNTCRSPMAEVILKTKLKLAGVENVRVSSAGVMATEGHLMNPKSRMALRNLGYKAGSFKAKRISFNDVKKYDLIVCMEEEQKKFFNGDKKAVTVKEATGLNNVLDPYGKDEFAYIKASHEIEDVCNVILKEILKVKGEQ